VMVFAVGVAAGGFWQAHRSNEKVVPSSANAEEPEWPLTNEIVSRSLQSHSFRTDKLKRNSHEEVVWRWLKQSIAAYPQNWVRLDISDEHSYGVVLYPLKTLDSATLKHYNQELNEKGMTALMESKRYLPIEVFVDNIVCPNWTGLIDIEEARLVYFEGLSA